MLDDISIRVKTLMKSMVDSSKPQHNYAHIMEPDVEHDEPNKKSKYDAGDPNMNAYGTHNLGAYPGGADFQLGALSQVQQNQIEESLKEACERELPCHIVFPEYLLFRVAADILRMSVAEPCGWKGCAIVLWLQEKGSSRKISTVFGSNVTPPTFEIHVTLREDTRSWRAFHKLFLTIKGCLINNSRMKKSTKILDSAYQLEKRRLYRVHAPSFTTLDSKNC